MQTPLSMIWTRVANSISCDDYRYATSASYAYVYAYMCVFV